MTSALGFKARVDSLACMLPRLRTTNSSETSLCLMKKYFLVQINFRKSSPTGFIRVHISSDRQETNGLRGSRQIPVKLAHWTCFISSSHRFLDKVTADWWVAITVFNSNLTGSFTTKAYTSNFVLVIPATSNHFSV